MINPNISELIGFEYLALDDHGAFGAINTPFEFEDGDPVPVYLEEIDGEIRFFDDGGVIMHFAGIGVPVDEKGEADFIRNAIAPSGARLNEMGEVEARGPAAHSPAIFARYISAILAMVRWEQERGTGIEERRRQALAADGGARDLLSA